MAINQVVAGAAALTSSATAFSASVPGAGQTFAVASDAGYPASGRFVVQLNRGESDEEKVLISSRSGTTFTVETRGYDGTTAQSHTNPTVNLILPATVVNALIEHADDAESDPHSTKLLNNTRHDTTSRHALGTVIPVSASAPTPIAPDDTGSAGAANAAARSDHRHAITTATAVAISTVSAEGVATSFARSDHTHAIPTDGVGATEIAPLSVTNAEIANTTIQSGKLNSAIYATPVSVGAANAAGSAATVARSDHVHDGAFTEVQQEESGTNIALTASFQTLLSFSLPAGTWKIEGDIEVQCSTTSRQTHTARIENTTDTSTIVTRRNSIDGETANNFHTFSLRKTVTLAGTKTIALQVLTSAVTGTQLADSYILEATLVRSVA